MRLHRERTYPVQRDGENIWVVMDRRMLKQQPIARPRVLINLLYNSRRDKDS